MNIKLLHITENATELIAKIAAISHNSAPKDYDAFIMKLLKLHHESIVEHGSASFLISGISRACTHQLVRHRLASFLQSSQRYIDMYNPEFVYPEDILNSKRAKEIYDSFLGNVLTTYRELRALGIKKEDARFVLPNATISKIVITGNFRTWRNFLKLRLDKKAQWEIRNVAKQIFILLYKKYPSIFDDLYESYESVCERNESAISRKCSY